MRKALVAHGGGPTAALNASLAGVIDASRSHFATLLAARFGLGGVLNADLRNLLCVPVPPALVAEVALTPGSAIGSSRARITDEDFSRMAEELRRREIRVVFYTGGNGSMQTALSLLRHARAADLDLQGRRSRG